MSCPSPTTRWCWGIGCRSGRGGRRCWRRTSRSPTSALDLIGQARLLYAYAGEVEGKGRGEDDLAYLRDEHAYANLLLVEQPNGDFAATMVRQLLYAAFMHPYLAGAADVGAMRGSPRSPPRR